MAVDRQSPPDDDSTGHGPDEPYTSLLDLPLSSDLNRIGEQLHALARAQSTLQELLQAVMSITGELELPTVLRRIVRTAMDLVGARYGAMGVLDQEGRLLEEFIPLGLTSKELAGLEGVELPRGRGLLGHLIHHPEPLRVKDISRHQESAGFPPGHPPMRTLLGVAISVRGRVYGNLYLSERKDGQPFDRHDEGVIRALAGTAGVAIENARLYQQVRNSSEQFQRLLLPRLPDLRPFTAGAAYRPASAPAAVGGDWYDAMVLPGGACAAVIGDVVGHDLRAAADMSQIRNMLRALYFDRHAPPGVSLARLDRIMNAALDEAPIATALLARLEPVDRAWRLRWSSAGHPPPLVLLPDGRVRYLDHEPGIPLGVAPDLHRPDHCDVLPTDSTVVLFTDGLVEIPGQPLDRGLDALAVTASRFAGLSPDELCRALITHRPGDGHDDKAVMALRTPRLTD
ncbi:SpoIIE family protein phosphatase [Streptomyces olivaceus]|uniref:SpoIIE family protein phosphatase n=1 Tax=Streptomyces olivaceus TaxID=47716 RepID=UPI00099F695A|nr:SpoIIE family protein phosphatase [Streptomyces olivaceus]MBZ6199300.1 SpoIIE family protein phosphatase [Streptomyces olivaceus]MBZ6292075.1 SpoIIE family protein phosphatase [Streptomyces olivaceus]MBZ6304235.1 SpoIIE family protein phosphatase [Streptomyces olivaceus]MBZ6318334.1 SpoIIE family protein phosphatase [Streptomyces olivaceus]